MRRTIFEDVQDTWYLEIPGIDESFTEWVRVCLISGEYVGWFALDESSAIVGGAGVRFIEWSPLSSDSASWRAYVNNMYVEKAHRRRGLARLLTATLLDYCRAKGIHHVALYASEQALPLYESLGFEMTNEMRLIL